MKTSRILRFIYLSLISIGMIGCGPSQKTRTNGSIVFQSDRGGSYDLYIMNPDGSDQRSLINSPASGNGTNNRVGPVPSPDGRKLAFQSDRDGNNEIYVFDIAGSVELNLTKNKSNDYSPTWSPDGKYLAFVSDRDAVLLSAGHDMWTNNIYIMDADGNNIRRLTIDNTKNQYGGLSWSPDGKKLAFGLSSLTPYGGFFSVGINLMTLSDSGISSLTSDPAAGNPRWSPDGKHLLFVSSQGLSSSIFTINNDGTNQVGLTKDASNYDTDPSWSPDGKYILFSSRQSAGYHIYIMNNDGTNRKRLTNGPGEETLPVWLFAP